VSTNGPVLSIRCLERRFGQREVIRRLDLALGPGELAVASAALLIPLLPFAGRGARMGVARA
jgi:hypothetical protein